MRRTLDILGDAKRRSKALLPAALSAAFLLMAAPALASTASISCATPDDQVVCTADGTYGPDQPDGEGQIEVQEDAGAGFHPVGTTESCADGTLEGTCNTTHSYIDVSSCYALSTGPDDIVITNPVERADVIWSGDGGTLLAEDSTTLNCLTDFTPVCGNGYVDSGETCDDTNTDDGDGCSASCQVEDGWSCVGAGTYVYGSCTEDAPPPAPPEGDPTVSATDANGLVGHLIDLIKAFWFTNTLTAVGITLLILLALAFGIIRWLRSR